MSPAEVTLLALERAESSSGLVCCSSGHCVCWSLALALLIVGAFAGVFIGAFVARSSGGGR